MNSSSGNLLWQLDLIARKGNVNIDAAAPIRADELEVAVGSTAGPRDTPRPPHLDDDGAMHLSHPTHR
jgi:hypothetical protein